MSEPTSRAETAASTMSSPNRKINLGSRHSLGRLRRGTAPASRRRRQRPVRPPGASESCGAAASNWAMACASMIADDVPLLDDVLTFHELDVHALDQRPGFAPVGLGELGIGLDVDLEVEDHQLGGRIGGGVPIRPVPRAEGDRPVADGRQHAGQFLGADPVAGVLDGEPGVDVGQQDVEQWLLGAAGRHTVEIGLRNLDEGAAGLLGKEPVRLGQRAAPDPRWWAGPGSWSWWWWSEAPAQNRAGW